MFKFSYVRNQQSVFSIKLFRTTCTRLCKTGLLFLRNIKEDKKFGENTIKLISRISVNFVITDTIA